VFNAHGILFKIIILVQTYVAYIAAHCRIKIINSLVCYDFGRSSMGGVVTGNIMKMNIGNNIRN